jgi:hypothetical protein
MKVSVRQFQEIGQTKTISDKRRNKNGCNLYDEILNSLYILK